MSSGQNVHQDETSEEKPKMRINFVKSAKFATQQQRDQCQNFSLGHRFVTIPLIVANAVKNGLSKLFITFGKSPRIGLYLLKLVFNCEETSAKILVLVTILWIKSLNETKDVKIGPCKFSIELFYVTTNWLIFQKTAPLKFIRLLKWSCLGHNNTKQAKNPECQVSRVDIAVEQCVSFIMANSCFSFSCISHFAFLPNELF